MKEQKIIKKVKLYLEKEKVDFLQDSLKLLGIKDDVKQLDGTVKPMYVVTYLIPSNSAETTTFFVNIDIESEELVYHITPHEILLIQENVPNKNNK